MSGVCRWPPNPNSRAPPPTHNLLSQVVWQCHSVRVSAAKWRVCHLYSGHGYPCHPTHLEYCWGIEIWWCWAPPIGECSSPNMDGTRLQWRALQPQRAHPLPICAHVEACSSSNRRDFRFAQRKLGFLAQGYTQKAKVRWLHGTN